MIKLFGTTIQLVPNKDEDNQLTSSTTTTTSHDTKDPTQSNHEESFGTEEAVEQANEEPRTPKVDEETTIAERGDPIILSGINEDPETSSVADTNEKEDPNDTSNSDEKTLKQPDKLVPCPRCSSLDTKFCYYNNYNVSQPRHFCKKCQRYWTAGGTMRNVPVGSGRRKNKCSPASQYCQIIVSESLQDARAGAANGIYQRNGNLLAFGSDSPHCESMVSAVNYMEKSENHVRNRCFEISEPKLPFFSGAQETGDDDSTRSSSTVLNHNEKVSCTGDRSKLKNIQESPTQVPCFPVPPWASPWNTAEWMSATQQPFRPSGFPISFYPTSNTQTLGKHCRDGSMVGSSDPEKVELEAKDLKRGVLTPKTLRIHDPVEAAKTSIWSTLGIKNEHTKPVNEAIRHEAFRAKGVQRYHMNKAASYGFASKPCSLATVI